MPKPAGWDERRLGRRLKLRDLHVLLTVARCGSMGKAASELSVSQPAISKAIADMEYALGVRLLDRASHGAEPTVYARPLLDGGSVVFDELKQAVKHIEFLANPTAGELRVGSTIAIATSFIPLVVDRLSRRHPRIVFHLLAGEAGTTYRALEERRADLVIVPTFARVAEERMKVDVLYEEPLVVVAGLQSPWARRRKVRLADLVNEVWTLPPLDSLYGSIIAEAFHAGGLEVPQSTVHTSTVPVRNALLATGRFFSIVPETVARFGTKEAALKVLPIDLQTTRRTIGIVTLKKRTLNPVAQLFIDCAHEMAKGFQPSKG
jgi:DNA-binding transcriptional LysR family regulator